MDLNILDRVAIITDASSGIGLETAKLLSAEVVKRLLTDLPDTDWSDVQNPLSDYETIEGDLTDQSDCDRVVKKANRWI
jgi:NADP-dependent 3-hydroxy acid dehydrogenase YdfG